jgi:hypothetical protein
MAAPSTPNTTPSKSKSAVATSSPIKSKSAAARSSPTKSAQANNVSSLSHEVNYEGEGMHIFLIIPKF